MTVYGDVIIISVGNRHAGVRAAWELIVETIAPPLGGVRVQVGDITVNRGVDVIGIEVIPFSMGAVMKVIVPDYRVKN